MTTPIYTPIDIVKFAAGKDAVGIQAAFDQMVGAKVADAIQQRKIDLAKSMFADAQDAEQEDGDNQQDSVKDGEQEEQESEESHEDAEQHA